MLSVLITASMKHIKFSQSREHKQSDSADAHVASSSQQELELFYEELNNANKKPAILRFQELQNHTSKNTFQVKSRGVPQTYYRTV